MRGRPRFSLEEIFFLIAIGVYLGVRLVGLSAYPIAFLGDEAVQVVDAARLVENGFRDEYGDLLPTYLRNGPYLNLGVSVYLQVVPYWLFGFSEVVARGVTVVVTLSGAVALSLLLRDVFRVRLWWTGVLLLSMAPAWFLHSRTALEAPIGCSFYAWFIALYLRFRVTETPWALYGAVAFGGLTFYSYAPLKVVVVVTTLLLLLSDARWLSARREVVGRAAVLVAIIALPELRFQLAHTGANIDQLRKLGSYMVDPELGVMDKVRRYGNLYARGLDPRYWYDPEQHTDLPRHVMSGYGNLLLATAPLALIGLVRALMRVRDTRFRAILLVTVAAPSGAAIVEIEMPRSLVVVIPLTLLTALGLDVICAALARVVRRSIVAIATLVVLSLLNVGMLADALRNGPTWYHDYGLYGLQFGGRQIAGAARAELDRHPDRNVVVSSSWGNASDTVMAFFLPDESRVRVENVRSLTPATTLRADLGTTTFVISPEELHHLRTDPAFAMPEVVGTIALPDGRPGFLLVHARYSRRAQSVVAARRRALRRPVTEDATINGARVKVSHTPFDGGAVEQLFDDNVFTYVRTADAKIMEVRIVFDRPRPIRRVRVDADEPVLAVQARVEAAADAPHRAAASTVGRRGQQMVVVTLGRDVVLARSLVLRILDPTEAADRHVVVREITLD